MSGIYGIFRFDGAPVVPEDLQWMRQAMAYYGPDGGGQWHDGPVGLGQLQLCITPEDRFEVQPLVKDGVTMVTAARLDNRDDLLRAFSIPSIDHATTPDSRLVLEAYLKWGEECPDHINGDWQFAVWDKRSRKLFLARDHHGNTGLYYHHNSRFLAFASNLAGLLSLPGVPQRPDLIRIANVLTCVTGDAIRTGYEELLRLLPAHTLRVTEQGVDKRRYWFPEHLPSLRFKNDQDYVEQFLEIFGQAVRVRLRSERPVGLALSGGLDSTSVASLAAPMLADSGKVLTAFTSVPIYDPAGANASCLGNEWPLAASAASHIGNIVHLPVRAEGANILESIKQLLQLHSEPGHAVGNYYWITAMLCQARDLGIGTLLTGQCGNSTISFEGSGSLLPDIIRGRYFEAARSLCLSEPNAWLALKRQVMKPILMPGIQLYRRQKPQNEPAWHDYSAINAEFAREIRLEERMRRAGHDPTFTTIPSYGLQLALLMLGANPFRSLLHELGAGYGLDMRDPTIDRHVLEFCLRIPDDQFRRRGETRWLIRRAMKGRLPAEVLYNQKFGCQAANLGHRVNRESKAFAELIDHLEQSELARQCLDLAKMRDALISLESGVTENSTDKCDAFLLRGGQIGLFLLGV